MIGLAAAGGASAPAVRAMAAPAYRILPDIVVAKDGSGHFKSVQAALDSIPKDNRQRLIIQVRDGVYEEAVRVDAPYVTLRGESRHGVKIAANRPAEQNKNEIGMAVLNGGPAAHDLVIENLTVHNTVEAVGPHAFAVLAASDRIIIQNADLLSNGADTLAMWRQGKGSQDARLSTAPGAAPLSDDGGRYYHRDVRVTGSVDFICPRGWCYMTDSVVEQVNPNAEAAFWHDGRGNPDKKFVIRNSRVDGPPDFYLARAHRDAQFFFIDCVFSARMRDQGPYLVHYPLKGGPPSEQDRAANAKIASETQAGVRSWFHGDHRQGGDFPWMADNLANAVGAPKAGDITAKWTFAGTWDPENPTGPHAIAVAFRDKRIEVTFDWLVTVKGKPALALKGGAQARYLGGGGSNILTFEAGGAANGASATRLVFSDGVVIGSEALTTLALANVALPRT